MLGAAGWPLGARHARLLAAIVSAAIGCGGGERAQRVDVARVARPIAAELRDHSGLEADAMPGVAPQPSALVVAPQGVPQGPALSTTRALAWIHERPSLDSPHLGHLRAGARLARSATPTPRSSATGTCEGAWWSVEPFGFVCEGHDGVTTRLDDPTVAAAAERPPDRSAPLPYGYGTSYGAPLYVRVPTAAEQARVEGDFAGKVAAIGATYAKLDPAKVPPRTALPIGELPEFLAEHRLAPPVVPWSIGAQATVAGWAWPSMRLAFTRAFEVDGRPFYLTTEHFIVPADRFRAARLAAFEGLHLVRPGEPGERLPMTWVRWKPARVFRLDAGRAVETELVLPFQAHAAIADRDVTLDGTRYSELLAPPAGAPDGARYLVRAEATTRVEPIAPEHCPKDLAPGERWIEVRLAQQVLILYEGTTPIFQTLVSTGVDGAGDPETTRSTPRGVFRIHSKHVTWRMAADEHEPWKEGDKPDPRYQIDDVPWVQYFSGGYALHAAFWHDSFGEPKSHGCVNLSPRDAQWLFGETLPRLPDGWHGVYGGNGAGPGTLLIVRN